MNGNYIVKLSQAKVLSSDLSWNAHVDEIISKASNRVYMLYQLKRAGINYYNLCICIWTCSIGVLCMAYKRT